MATRIELFNVAKAKALEAIEKGALEEAQERRKEAESLKALIETEEAVKGLDIPKTDPIRPPMPGGAPEEKAAKADEPEVPYTVKAFYEKRFGERDAGVDRILKDMHGGDYMTRYWNQRQSFFKYLRYGSPRMTADDWVAVRDPVWTPESIANALLKGFDSVANLKATMIESAEALGGAWAPVDFQARLIERVAAVAQVRQRTTPIPTSRDTLELPKSTGGGSQYANAVRVTWVDEQPSSTAAATNLSTGLEKIPVHTCMATVTLSKNMLEDAAFPIEPYLTRVFGEALAINEDNLFLTGDGTSGPQGIVPDSANGLSLSYGINPSSTTAVEWDGLISTMFKLDQQYRQNAAWIMEKATYEDVAQLKDSYGQYLWRERFGDNVAEGFHQRLMGSPALEQEAMPSVEASAFVAIYGDLSGYTIAERVGMSVQRYDDSTTASQNQVKIVMRRRLGGKVTEPWRFVLYKVATS